MRIRKILKISTLIIGIVVVAILANFIIQRKIQDVDSKSANDNLIKIVTKKAEKEVLKQNEKEQNNSEEEKIQDTQNNENGEETEENKQNNNNNKRMVYENLEVKEKANTKEQIIQVVSKEKNMVNTKDKIDWDKLNSINKDIIGWIEIPNTNINYPILKDENLYYLNHNYQGKTNRNGSIFIRNNDLFESEEITIYGHNMKNGTMFATLAKYVNKDFLANNSKFYIYTKANTYKGHIFVAYSKGVKEEKEAIKSFNLAERVKYYKKQGEYFEKLENNVDKIVKLTTCSYINARTSPTDQRYYVIAEMVKSD